jgi:hypothetical protein
MKPDREELNAIRSGKGGPQIISSQKTHRQGLPIDQ